jgi:hypothetical protein
MEFAAGASRADLAARHGRAAERGDGGGEKRVPEVCFMLGFLLLSGLNPGGDCRGQRCRTGPILACSGAAFMDMTAMARGLFRG